MTKPGLEVNKERDRRRLGVTRRQILGVPLAVAAPFVMTRAAVAPDVEPTAAAPSVTTSNLPGDGTSGAITQVATAGDGTSGAVSTPQAVPTSIPTPAGQIQSGLLPHSRVVSYYGFPGNEYMGILGEYDKDTLLAKLQDQAAGYEAADPSRPVKSAFEVVSSVAQHDPGSDGSYIVDIDNDTLQEYADYAAQQGILLILDVQFGRLTVEEEMDRYMKWMEQPHIHLALDPEFAIQQGETPGVDLGSIPAAWITYAQNRLAKFTADKGLPPKILVVHQFRYSMISDKNTLKPVDGVQLVIVADGFGDPDLKIKVYNQLKGAPVQYNGIKLFYKQDVPLMPPTQVLSLHPVPDLVIYQ